MGEVNADDLWLEESREFAFACDFEGTIRWADERARLRFGMQPGKRLHALTPPGVEGKLNAFLERAKQGLAKTTELPLVSGSQVVTCFFHAKPPHDGQLQMLG